MTAPDPSPPPIPGDWQPGAVTRTGAWTAGDLWVDWATGRYALQVEDRHCNATGLMHGGAMTTFLDGQAFVVAQDQMKDRHTPTISLAVDFLAPPKPGDWLVAHVELVKVTRSLIVTQALAKIGDRVVARSNALYSNSQGKDAP